MSVPPEPPPGLYTAPRPLVIEPPRAPVGPPADGGAFTVDVDRAPQVLRDLRDARDQLVSIRNDALLLGRIDPGSRDEVSRDVARLIGAVAVGGPGNLLDALDAGIARVTGLIDAIQAELHAYLVAEDSASEGFGERS